MNSVSSFTFEQKQQSFLKLQDFLENKLKNNEPFFVGRLSGNEPNMCGKVLNKQNIPKKLIFEMLHTAGIHFTCNDDVKEYVRLYIQSCQKCNMLGIWCGGMYFQGEILYNIIDATAKISKFSKIGKGNMIMVNSLIGANTKVSNFISRRSCPRKVFVVTSTILCYNCSTIKRRREVRRGNMTEMMIYSVCPFPINFKRIEIYIFCIGNIPWRFTTKRLLVCKDYINIIYCKIAII